MISLDVERFERSLNKVEDCVFRFVEVRIFRNYGGKNVGLSLLTLNDAPDRTANRGNLPVSVW